MTTVRNLPLISGSQNGYVSHNTALVEVAAMAFNQIKSTESTPPSSPTLHDMHIVDFFPQGDWATFSPGNLAYYDVNNAWVQYVPNDGLILYHLGENKLKVYSSGSWSDAPGGSGGGGGGLAIEYFDNNLDATNTYTVDSSKNNTKIVMQPYLDDNTSIDFSGITSAFYCEMEINNITNTPFTLSFNGTNGTSLFGNIYSTTKDCSLVAYYDSTFGSLTIVAKVNSNLNPLGQEDFIVSVLPIEAYRNEQTTYLDCATLTTNRTLALDLLQMKEAFSTKFKFYNVPSGITIDVTLTGGGTLVARRAITSFTQDSTVEVCRVFNNNVYLDIY